MLRGRRKAHPDPERLVPRVAVQRTDDGHQNGVAASPWPAALSEPAARGASRSEVFERALERWLRDLRRRSLEEDAERYYSSLSRTERAEDSEWAGLAPRVLGETWG
jgi:hypothetical protein